jgi:NAD(P)H-nitrite reductase large subunit
MSLERVAIIGTGPAGMAAARGYRDAGGIADVALIGEEQHAPYQRPPLTKEFLRGEIDREELFIESAQWFAEHSVTLHLGRPVEEIDSRRGEIRLADAGKLAADVCVLATGSEPTRPPFPGADHPGVLLMRRLPDSETLARHAAGGADTVVIGSGFIGCEAAASLATLGLRVTMVSLEPLPQAQRLGEAAAHRIASWLEEAGIELVLDAEVQEIQDATRVLVDGRPPIEAETVVLAAGVAPRSELAAACGLELHEGAVPVDASMRSRDPFVRAAGDVAYAENVSAGRALRVEHWGDALGQGEVAGRSLAGEPARWEEVPGFWSTIGGHTLKYAAWGDGFDDYRLDEHGGGAFTVWYERDGVAVGVLTHERDEDYERGRDLIAEAAKL